MRSKPSTKPPRRVLSDVVAAAAVTPGDIDLLELYSCFPVVSVLGLDALDLDYDTPTSVAGGLTFYGGPLNAYMACATVAMVRALRRRDGELGLLHGNGEYLTKHHALMLGRQPASSGFVADDPATRQASLDARPQPEVVECSRGAATVETWTVIYDRQGRPARGVIVARQEDGARFVANTGDDDEILDVLTGGERIFRRPGRVSTSEGGSHFEFT